MLNGMDGLDPEVGEWFNHNSIYYKYWALFVGFKLSFCLFILEVALA